MTRFKHPFAAVFIALILASASHAATDFEAKAREVTEYIQKEFYNPQTHLYVHASNDRHVEDMWGDGVIFSALVAAARHDPATYEPVLRDFFGAMDAYW